MKKFAVILGGCGTMDGSEIHESTLTLLAIKKLGADYQIFAPDKDQHYVWNHYKANEMPEKRNMLVEAARIARGDIKELGEYKPENFDALVIPGGNGIAKNLCNFAFKGAACEVYPPLAEALRKTAALKKPIGAMCIAPVILGKVFGKVVITLGGESGSLNEALKMGIIHKKTSHGEVAIDKEHLIFTAPCYMLDATIADVAIDTEALIKTMLDAMK
jgi:enhancing lycopene biosynthesis protein 2